MPMSEITKNETLLAAREQAKMGDPDVNRYLVDEVLSGLRDGSLHADLARWFAEKLEPVAHGREQFDVAFHLRKKRGGQKGTGRDDLPDEVILLGSEILKIIEPGLNKTAVNNKIAELLCVSSDRIRDVLYRCHENGISFRGSSLEDLSSYEGFEMWVKLLKLKFGG